MNDVSMMMFKPLTSGDAALVSCFAQLHGVSLEVAANPPSISARSALQANSPEHATNGVEITTTTRRARPKPSAA
jgi:hypothetical protein